MRCGAVDEARPLQFARHRVDAPQTLDGIGLVHGQVDDDQRHEVAQRLAVFLLAAQRHRHHGLDRPVLDVGVAVLEQERAQGAAARGQHDVVDRHPVPLANGADALHRRRCVDPATVLTDRHVPRCRWRLGEEVGDGPPDVGRRVDHRPGVAECVDSGLCEARSSHSLFLQGGHQQLVRRWGGSRSPDRCLLVGRWVGLEIDEHRREVDVGHPVAESVVHLDDQPDMVIGQAVDEPQLPQRARPVERQRLEATHQRGELIIVARTGERGEADVVTDVEVVVVDPHGSGLVVRHLHHPLTRPRNTMQTPLDVLLEFVEADSSVGVA